MSSKLGLKLSRYYSINFDLPKRHKKFIKFIIIHYTGMRKQSQALKKLCDFKSKVSCHYFIKDNGEVLNLVPDLYNAWHAGKSHWSKYKFLNKYSIGIEINNPGHNNKYRKFFPRQINSLVKLLRALIKKYKINKKNILGHSDIAPDRKKDPGEKFPWKVLAKKNVCRWHDLNDIKIKKFRKQRLNLHEEKIFFKNLNMIGYPLGQKNEKSNKIYVVKAFQRKFRQKLIDGKTDFECLLISKSLIKPN